MSFSVQVVEGVVGGFAPPVPKRSVIIDSVNGKVSIQKFVKSSDQQAVEGYLQTKSAELQASEISEVTAFLNEIKGLPMEKPTGCMDIYGFDVSVKIEAEGFQWQNLPNQGCNSTPSSVVPTAEQKKQFKSIVDKINQLADKHATIVWQ
ncbi:hypothetical protein HDV06_006855 [Boothiomyces sp. JEL0866]|nr:hypothetical protein HDV06_006855 [Boothiomyces sp. JEL0866]